MSADTHLAGSFVPHNSSHPGEGGTANKTMSIVKHEERMDQIMKIDTQALLKTIQDLEKRLSEHQRQDNIPPWAQALQNRMEAMEKMRNSFVENDSSGVSKNVGSETMNLSTLTMEERIISKIRSEFETKIGNSQLHFEGIISSYSLEMERLHKLLMIRPTTSELQQVVLNVQQQEHRTQQHLQDMQNLIMANVRDRISEEMVGCLLELRNARAAGEEGSRLIAKQISDFTSQMGELREGAQNSIIALQDAQAESKLLMEAQKGDIEQSRRQLKEEIHKVNSITLSLKNEVKATSESLADQSARMEDALAKIDDRLKAENIRLQKELEEMKSKLEAVEHAQVEAETVLAQVKFNFEREMDDLREWRKSLDHKFQEADKRQFSTEKQVSELVSQNFGSQIKKAYDQNDKLAADLEQLTNLCQQTLAQDIKSNTLKISLLQEQCNIAIPKTLSDHAMRMTDLYENLKSTSESIEILKGRHDQEDALIASLMPLKDKVAYLADAKTAHETELNNLKEGITSCIDANSEFARRMEEFEEAMESFDESINSRMNRIRDTLLDTLLDKHGEATAAVRNARENLEVMSMAAGEAGISMGGGGGGGGGAGYDAGGPGGVAGGKGRPTMGPGGVAGPRMTVVHREADNGAVVSSQSAGAGNIGQLKKMQSYRVPNMQGQVVQGVPAQTSDPAGGAASGSQPAPMLGGPPGMMRKQSSMRMQHQTQNILNQHRKIVGMSAHTEGNAGSGDAPAAIAPASQPPNVNNSVPGASSAGNTVVIPLPQTTDYTAPPSPEHPSTSQPTTANVAPEGDHPAIELSPLVKQQQQQQQQDPEHVAYGNDVSSHQNAPPLSHQTSAPSSAPGTAYQHATQIPQIHQKQAQHYHHQSTPQMQHQAAYHQPPMQQQQQYVPPAYDVGIPMSSMPAPVASRADVISNEYNHLLNQHQHGAMNEADVDHEAQFLADLCLNFEDISLKRKKVSSLPLTFCQSIAQVTRAMAELIAEQADFEMVEQSIAAVNGPLVVQDVTYDESFVVNTRQKKQDEYIELVLQHVNRQVQNGGVLRADARQLFIALIRKALDMFMSKHNQVLIAGNSRLGRVKIPSCIACDRPLVEKSRLDRSLGSPPTGTRGLMEQSAATLRTGWSSQGGFNDEDPASHVFPAAHLENSQVSSSMSAPGKGILGRGLLSASLDSQRPKTMTGGRANNNNNNSAKVLKSSTLRPNSSVVM